MNNSNGAALLARVKAGDLVTVRTDEGRLIAGRAQYNALWEQWRIEYGRARFNVLTADNILRVEP